MADFQSDSPGGPAACDGWLAVGEELIAGVHHTLNNRMAALSAVAQVLEADLPSEHPLAGAMSKELLRLEGTVSLLSLLTGDSGAEAVQLEGIIEEAARLFEMHHSLRDLRLEVELAGDLYPLWISPSALRRALMLMLAIAGSRAGGDGVVQIVATGDAEVVEVRVRCSERTGDSPFGGDATGEEIDFVGAGALLSRWGGTVEEEEGERGVSLLASLLTLPESRRREAAGEL